MTDKLTHWKKLTNPNYLGVYALEDKKDIIVTIKSVKREMVTGEGGKKEECTVAYFTENVKPMILNATNSKTITKIYGTPYIEEWTNKKIQIYADMVSVKGEMVEALRIRAYEPKTVQAKKCSDCSTEIKGFEKFSAEQVANSSLNKYGKYLCKECAVKAKDVASVKAKEAAVVKANTNTADTPVKEEPVPDATAELGYKEEF